LELQERHGRLSTPFEERNQIDVVSGANSSGRSRVDAAVTPFQWDSVIPFDPKLVSGIRNLNPEQEDLYFSRRSPPVRVFDADMIPF
jgi:hypothetical protein